MSATVLSANAFALASITTTCIDDALGFRALRNDWQSLYGKCQGATPFNSWEWLFSWWQAYGGARQLRLLAWRVDNDLIGVTPLYLALEKTQVGTDCRVLRLVGDGSFDSDYLGPLIQPEAEAAVFKCFGEWLRNNQEWDALVFRELTEHSPLPVEMQGHAERARWLFRMEYGRCGVLDLPQSFEVYLRARQSRFRTKLRSLLKRLDESELVFESRCEPDQLRGRLRSLFSLHQRRWQNSGASGVFGGKDKRRFYAHFVPRFARCGWLRLYSLRSGTDYLAHQLCFGGNGITYLLQEGFDVSNPAASYGQMLRAAVVRDLIQRGETRYDFLGGYSKHKEDWGAQEAKTVHVTLARRQWRGWLYFNVPLWRERLAVEAKRGLPGGVLKRLRRTAATGS